MKKTRVVRCPADPNIDGIGNMMIRGLAENIPISTTGITKKANHAKQDVTKNTTVAIDKSNNTTGDKNADTLTTTGRRCQKNAIHLDAKKNTNLKNIIIKQMTASRIVYNQALFCQRTWFTHVHGKIIDYYIEHMDDHLLDFSTEDKKLIFAELIRRKDYKKVSWLYFFCRASEEHSFDGMVDKLKKINPTFVISEPLFYTHDEITYQHNGREYKSKIKYQYDAHSYTHVINKLGIKQFDNGHGNTEFLVILNKIIDEKFQKNNAVNHVEENDTVKKVIYKTHLIPPSYLFYGIVDRYLKLYFDGLTKKRKYNALETIGSQVAQQTLKKLDEAYSSFFAGLKRYKILCAKPFNTKSKIKLTPPKPPDYCKSTCYSLIFQNTSFSVRNRGDVKYARLSLGRKMKKQVEISDPASEGYMWFKIPKNIIDKEIVEIELTPCNDKTMCYINYKYTVTLPSKKKRVDDVSHKVVSVDFGVVNMITAFSLHFDNPLIYKGGYVRHINGKYKYLIEKIYQPAMDVAKRKNNLKRVQKIKDHIHKLWRRRDHIIHDHFNKVSHDFVKKCSVYGINEIILGYNVNWKTSVNMGHKNNSTFCMIPYRKIISMIQCKAEKHGIIVTEQNEAYTSICDALSWETIERHDNYLGERQTSGGKRGLFISGKISCNSNKRIHINSDVNGAMNIMRKGLADNDVLLDELKKGFENHTKICNARIISMTKPNENANIVGNETPTKILKKHKPTKKHIVPFDCRKSIRNANVKTKPFDFSFLAKFRSACDMRFQIA